MYNAELQMLREFWWLHAPKTNCVFCGEPLEQRPVGMSFGHRRHPKVRSKFTVHHDDENRQNNSEVNLKNSHPPCHKRYHKALLIAAGKVQECSPANPATKNTVTLPQTS